jgi:hypothetical protein
VLILPRVDADAFAYGFDLVALDGEGSAARDRS